VQPAEPRRLFHPVANEQIGLVMLGGNLPAARSLCGMDGRQIAAPKTGLGLQGRAARRQQLVGTISCAMAHPATNELDSHRYLCPPLLQGSRSQTW
jgi:hypothetical protein